MTRGSDGSELLAAVQEDDTVFVVSFFFTFMQVLYIRYFRQQ